MEKGKKKNGGEIALDMTGEKRKSALSVPRKREKERGVAYCSSSQGD